MATPLAFALHDGGAPCVTLLHGFPLDSRMWEQTARHLAARGRQALAPDLPGAGHSPVPEGASMASLADAVAATWRDLGVADNVVVGFSMGGYVALELARRHPAQVKGLALVDTRAGADTEEGRLGRDRTAAQVRAEGMNALASRMLGGLLTAATVEARPELAAHVREMMLRQEPEGVARLLEGMRDRADLRSQLGAVRVPALVLVGTQDTVTPPSEARAMAAALPDATLVEIPDAAHLTVLERPQAWLHALDGWLDARWVVPTPKRAPRG